MTANDLNQQSISFSGQSSKSRVLTGINGIYDYFHKSTGAVVWNIDQYLGPAYSINGSAIVSFSFADSNVI